MSDVFKLLKMSQRLLIVFLYLLYVRLHAVELATPNQYDVLNWNLSKVGESTGEGVPNEMEPVIQIEFDDDTLDNNDARREAVKYVKENYEEIEEKMRGHQLGT